MRQVQSLRPLSEDEKQQLMAGLRSSKAFTLRRCQILLASAEGETPCRIAHIVGCTTTTVSHVIKDFSARGITCVHEELRRPGALPRGCPRVEEKEPGIIDALEKLLVLNISRSYGTRPRAGRLPPTRSRKRWRWSR